MTLIFDQYHILKKTVNQFYKVHKNNKYSLKKQSILLNLMKKLKFCRKNVHYSNFEMVVIYAMVEIKILIGV